LPVLSDWNLDVSTDDVLWSQGSDPAIIRRRSPRIAEIAEQAVIDGSPYLRPSAVYEIYDIERVLHYKLKLSKKGVLKSPLVIEHLAAAKQVAVVCYTIGIELEKYAAQVMKTDFSLGLALNGLGSAAVGELGTAVCNYLAAEVADENAQSTIPISPGLEGWPTREGQFQISSLVDFSAIDVELNASGTMLPLKSSTMVIGLGADVSADGSICDYCAIGEQCGFKEEHLRVSQHERT
jgi:hypothetical protein